MVKYCFIIQVSDPNIQNITYYSIKRSLYRKMKIKEARKKLKNRIIIFEFNSNVILKNILN